jgi:calcineurin-like phosphoesterase family protein
MEVSMVGEPGNINFLFRFRDLVAATVEEHRKIIEEHETCWWGWWKRPSEDSRQSVWTELENAISSNGFQQIGLFDSGGNNVRPARVVGIVRPREEDGSAVLVDVPEGERDLIPSYYRKSPFSRAWMKLSMIGDPIDDFFSHYSYAEAPKVLNYTSVTLEKFKGKVILSAEELRGMDTTIWKVRKAVDSDSIKSMILGVPALPWAISPEPVKCNSDVVLHITDPHFVAPGPGRNRKQHVWRLESEVDDVTAPTLVEAITRALNGKTVGLIIVTGDVTFMGSEEEFEEARRNLSLLLGIFNLGADNLVIIPGNHDIVWSTDATYKDKAEVKNAPPTAKENYKRFYKDLFGHEPSVHLSMGRRFLLPSGLSLEICALNSSSLSTGEKFLAGMGKIDDASFEKVATDLGWTNPQTLALRMLAIHHHLALTEDAEEADGYSRGYGIAVDAVGIQRVAAKHGVQLALHGHKHRSFIWRSSVYELPEQANPRYKLGDLSIIGGGSAGSKETDGYKNYFNLLYFSPAELRLEIWRSIQRRAFSLMQEWQASLEIDGEKRKLILNDWSFVK